MGRTTARVLALAILLFTGGAGAYNGLSGGAATALTAAGVWWATTRNARPDVTGAPVPH